jgi:hypothetical protein
MTMRTYRYFSCPNGHQGVETTSENDQPYSKPWEQVSTQGLKNGPKDAMGYDTYLCLTCGSPMAPATRPMP